MSNSFDSYNETKERTILINSEINEVFAKTKITQIYKNESKNPIELKIYAYKYQNLILSNFRVKIGDSIIVKSKIIKREKGEEKYSDSISSGNAAIYVINDPFDKNRIIINMGNISNNEEVLFEIEYIQFIEYSNLYKFELFSCLSFFQIDDSIYQFYKLEGNLEIKTKSKIIKIEKNILMDNVKIIEEKYQNEEKNNYLII